MNITCILRWRITISKNGAYGTNELSAILLNWILLNSNQFLINWLTILYIFFCFVLFVNLVLRTWHEETPLVRIMIQRINRTCSFYFTIFRLALIAIIITVLINAYLMLPTYANWPKVLQLEILWFVLYSHCFVELNCIQSIA